MAKRCVALEDLGRRSLLRTWERACRKTGQANGMQNTWTEFAFSSRAGGGE